MMFFFHRGSTTVVSVCLFCDVPRSQSDKPHLVGLSWIKISLTQIFLPDNIQQSQDRDIHAPGGIQTGNPSKRTTVDPHFRPRDRWEWLKLILETYFARFDSSLTLWPCNWTLKSITSFRLNVNILRTKTRKVMKYKTFCRGIN